MVNKRRLRRGVARGMVACAALCLATGADSAAALQEGAPRLPFGSVAVVLPVQSSAPSVGGSWPGLAVSEERALRALDAELEFALAERRAATDWALPADLRRRLERNPTLDVDPERVAYQGLLAAPDRRDQLYEPLHGQLRTLAALFGTRFVVLPLRVSSRPAAVADADAGRSPGASAETCRAGAPPERAELLLALIDIRRSAVLWHGTIRGPRGCPEAGALLAGLAAEVALHLTES